MTKIQCRAIRNNTRREVKFTSGESHMTMRLDELPKEVIMELALFGLTQRAKDHVWSTCAGKNETPQAVMHQLGKAYASFLAGELFPRK